MDRITVRMGEKMEVTRRWQLSFERVQPGGGQYMGAVWTSKSGVGGEIILDWRLLTAQKNLGSHRLRTRMQSVLTHEVCEGQTTQALRGTGLHESQIPEIYTHNSAVSGAPGTTLWIFPESRQSLEVWRLRGPYNGGEF